MNIRETSTGAHLPGDCPQTPCGKGSSGTGAWGLLPSFAFPLLDGALPLLAHPQIQKGIP